MNARIEQLGVNVAVVVGWLVPDCLGTLWAESSGDDNWGDIWTRGEDMMEGRS